MDDDALLDLLRAAAVAVRHRLDGLDDWGLAGTVPGQHLSDLAADAAVLEVLDAADVGVLSEESGRRHPDRAITVVVDPLDGSTNAAHGLPWYATSLCAVDAGGPRVAVVVNQATGTRFEAVRGAGATCDDTPIVPSTITELADAIVAITGYPPRDLGWRQFRALGAAALDLCAVASGALDGWVDCTESTHGPWDYLGGLLVCREAGALVTDAHDRELVVIDGAERRTPVAAGSAPLFELLVAARRGFPD